MSTCGRWRMLDSSVWLSFHRSRVGRGKIESVESFDGSSAITTSIALAFYKHAIVGCIRNRLKRVGVRITSDSMIL